VITIASIVEGHGEVKALPILIRRILNEVGIYPQVPEPHRLRVRKWPLRRTSAARPGWHRSESPQVAVF
jgi:hypothetical protein